MYRIEIHTGIESHSVQSAGQSVLDCILESGVPVGYSCRRGDCGQCVAALVSGEVASINADQPSVRGNDIFLCNTVACSDLSVRLPYHPELLGIPFLRSPAKIHEISHLGESVAELVLRLPPTQSFKFLPGQFVRLSRQGIVRSYSLATGPDDSKLLRIHIKRVPNGVFSDYLFGPAKPGDLLYLEGPGGHFFVKQSAAHRGTIFLATGTGIAPIRAILLSLTDEQRLALGNIHIYWGNRHASDEYLRDEIQALALNHGYAYWPVHSRESSSHKHVQDLMEQHHEDLSGYAIFACGNPRMIESARVKSAQLGVLADHFYADPFTSS